LEFLANFLNYFETESEHEIRGASLFIVIDHPKNQFRIKFIDLGSFKHTGKPDEGLVFGFKTLMQTLKSFTQ